VVFNVLCEQLYLADYVRLYIQPPETRLLLFIGIEVPLADFEHLLVVFEKVLVF
jgi:hypothetical protein